MIIVVLVCGDAWMVRPAVVESVIGPGDVAWSIVRSRWCLSFSRAGRIVVRKEIVCDAVM